MARGRMRLTVHGQPSALPLLPADAKGVVCLTTRLHDIALAWVASGDAERFSRLYEHRCRLLPYIRTPVHRPRAWGSMHISAFLSHLPPFSSQLLCSRDDITYEINKRFRAEVIIMYNGVGRGEYVLLSVRCGGVEKGGRGRAAIPGRWILYSEK